MSDEQARIADRSSAENPCAACDQVREADHRIANHLALLAGYVRLKASELAAPSERADAATTRMVLGAVGVQLDLIAGLHRGFLSASPDATVQLPKRLDQLCAVVRGAMGEGDLRIDLPADYPMAPALVAPVTQAVAEALINAVKHGALPGAAPQIHLRAVRLADGGLSIEVTDQGPGLTLAPPPSGGSGLSLMHRLCDQIGAELTFDSQAEGLTVRMLLPGPSRTVRRGPPTR